jgi:hypothetical protein
MTDCPADLLGVHDIDPGTRQCRRCGRSEMMIHMQDDRRGRVEGTMMNDRDGDKVQELRESAVLLTSRLEEANKRIRELEAKLSLDAKVADAEQRMKQAAAEGLVAQFMRAHPGTRPEECRIVETRTAERVSWSVERFYPSGRCPNCDPALAVDGQ